MKLYYSPGACSLADHIALHEAELQFDHIKVDLKAKKTETGDDYTTINPKGYVPALTLDGGETITENLAILDWIAHQAPVLKPDGALGHTRLLETLAYISTELHKSFAPFFGGGSDEDKKKAGDKIGQRLGLLADNLDGDYLFGSQISVADAYLFVMLLWAKKNDLAIPQPLEAFRDRMIKRDAVKTAMTHEGLI